MSSQSPRHLDFERSIAFLVSALANKLNSCASRRLRRNLDIGLMEWRVIALLGVEQATTPARISQVAAVDKSVVSRAVNALERQALIRVSSDGGAGRQTRLELTSKGRELHERGMRQTVQAEELFLTGVTAEEQEILVALLKRLTANMQLLDADPSA